LLYSNVMTHRVREHMYTYICICIHTYKHKSTVKTSTSLRSLSLYGSGITASAAKVLAEALASHEFLTMLDLGCNALGAKGVEDVRLSEGERERERERKRQGEERERERERHPETE